MSAEPPRLLTVTPNPSLDLLYTTTTLRWDDANRMDEPRRRPGGQGINVARVAARLGAHVTAVALLGGWTGSEIERILAREHLRLVAVPAGGETRLFIAVHATARGRSLLINGRGEARTHEHAQQLLDTARAAIDEKRPHWVAACGSLPPGFPANFYARLGELAKAAGARFVPDCDGPALAAAAPLADLLVPNRHEAARLLNWPAIANLEQALDAASALATPARAAAITLGPHGAILATHNGVWHARAPHQTGHAVGAGDAFLAALICRYQELPEALRDAVAAGAAVLRSIGSDLFDLADQQSLARSVRVRDFTARQMPPRRREKP